MRHRSNLRVRAALLAGLVVLLLGGLAGSPAASAQTDGESGLEIRNVDASSYPLIRAVVAGPGVEGELDDAFVVVEDGEEQAVDVVRLRADQLNVVVAIDVSGSMEGEPLQRAKDAVGELLANLPDTVPVSVVSFGAGAIVQHDFSTDRESIQSSVDGLIAAGGTALYDGVQLSLAQLAARGGTSAMVLLADGGDSTSATPPAQVIERLAATDVSASFVALQTPDFDLGVVQALADAASGEVVAVEQAAQFGEAFGRIAAGLSGFYELRWTSASEGDSADVTISLAADPQRSASTTFAHSEVRQFVPDIADDSRTVSGAGIFGATWIPFVAALGVSAGALALLFMMRTSEVATERREERKKDKDARKADRVRQKSGVQSRLEGFSAHVLEKNNRGRSLDDTLDRAGIAMRSNEFVVVCAAVAAGSLLFGVFLFGVPFFLLAGIIPVGGIPLFLKFKIAMRRKKFVAQLGDTLQLMAGSLTAGYGLGQTLDSVAREADAPTSEEFQRVVMETRLGRSLEDALDAMSHRIQAPDFDWVVDAIKIQSSVGGNLSEIIQQVGETIRARTRIRRQVDALTAEGKISALVLFCLPFALFGFIFSSNPDYISPMFSSGMGQGMLGAAIFMLVCGGLWLKKLVNPEF